MDSHMTLTGNLVRDPISRTTKEGHAVVTLRVASTPRRRDASGEWRDGETLFMNVVCWRQLARNVAYSLRKGDAVIVHGRVQPHTWERDGQTHTELEIEATSVGTELTRAAAPPMKQRIDPPVPEQASGDPGEPSVVEDAATDDAGELVEGAAA